MVIVSIVNPKGGSGKTTTSANLAGALADMGQRVLMLDLDRQPTLSSYYELQEQAPRGILSLLTRNSWDGVISTTTMQNLHLVYSDDPEGRLEQWVKDTADGRVRLKFLLEEIEDDYDVVVLDSQGARGSYQDVAALAGTMLLSPIPPEMSAAREYLRGVSAMIQELKPMGRLGAPVGSLYGLIYGMDRTRLSADVASLVRQQSALPNGTHLHVLNTVVPNATSWREAAADRRPVHLYEPDRRGPTASGREVMRGIIAELLPYLAERPFSDELAE